MGFDVLDRNGALRVGPGTSTVTKTTTGNIDDLDFSNASLIRMNNASLATIRGLKAGVDGQIVTIVSIGAGEVDFAHQNAGSSAGNRLINFVTSGITPLAAGFGAATYQYDSTTARWRLIDHSQGNWINVPYSAGNFTASTGTWTVDAGDQTSFAYWLKDTTLHVALSLNSTSVSATPVALQIAIPNGYTTPVESRMADFTQDNGGVVGTGMLRVVGGGGTAIFCYKDPAANNWSASTNATSFNGTTLFAVT